MDPLDGVGEVGHILCRIAHEFSPSGNLFDPPVGNDQDAVAGGLQEKILVGKTVAPALAIAPEHDRKGQVGRGMGWHVDGVFGEGRVFKVGLM